MMPFVMRCFHIAQVLTISSLGLCLDGGKSYDETMGANDIGAVFAGTAVNSIASYCTPPAKFAAREIVKRDEGLSLERDRSPE